jgi:hypothetical protein
MRGIAIPPGTTDESGFDSAITMCPISGLNEKLPSIFAKMHNYRRCENHEKISIFTRCRVHCFLRKQVIQDNKAQFSVLQIFRKNHNIHDW